MAECTEGDRLNQEIFDAVAQLIGGVLANAERLAGEFGLPLFAVKAMHYLDGGIAMKELGRRMSCDPSFVTSIADSLESRGLARREPNPADRRIKNLVLTTEGLDLKERLERDMVASMPWCHALDLAERKSLLTIVRKLTDAEAAQGTAVPGAGRSPPSSRGRTRGGGDRPVKPCPGGRTLTREAPGAQPRRHLAARECHTPPLPCVIAEDGIAQPSTHRGL
ncbi:MAG: MarR family winged helix-turn-helix transcriptional regulator [Streptosporangiales bacterium]